MQRRSADLALDARVEHGEGPLWDDRTGLLAWVDLVGCAVHLLEPDRGRDVAVRLDQQVGAVAVREAGGLLVAVERGLVTWESADLAVPGDLDPPPRRATVAVDVEAHDPTTRTNDGAADPRGRYWIGTMAHDEASGAGTLYRVDADGSLHAQVRDATIPNGIAWERDGATAYFIDSAEQRVDRLVVDPASGDVVERVAHLDLSDAPGAPDGMTIDVEGGLWVALWGGWQVRRYAPDGRLDMIVDLPVAHVTSCVHGGGGLRDLFVTTSRRDLNDAERAATPHAGSVFCVEVDVPGHPPDRVAL